MQNFLFLIILSISFNVHSADPIEQQNRCITKSQMFSDLVKSTIIERDFNGKNGINFVINALETEFKDNSRYQGFKNPDLFDLDAQSIATDLLLLRTKLNKPAKTVSPQTETFMNDYYQDNQIVKNPKTKEDKEIRKSLARSLEALVLNLPSDQKIKKLKEVIPNGSTYMEDDIGLTGIGVKLSKNELSTKINFLCYGVKDCHTSIAPIIEHGVSVHLDRDRAKKKVNIQKVIFTHNTKQIVLNDFTDFSIYLDPSCKGLFSKAKTNGTNITKMTKSKIKTKILSEPKHEIIKSGNRNAIKE